MPRRDTEMTTINYMFNGREKSFQMPKEQHLKIEKLKEEAPKHNELTTRYCGIIAEALKGIEVNAVVKTRPFRKVDEGLGLEYMKPRNYLTNEVIEIYLNGSDKSDNHYWGEFSDVDEAVKQIVERIKNGYVREQPKYTPPKRDEPRPNENGESSVGVIEELRTQFRRRKF